PMSRLTLAAAASVKCSGGSRSAQSGWLIALFSDQFHRARGRGVLVGRGRPMLALVDQLAVDLGADRHLDQLVLDVPYDPGPRTEFDPLRRLDVALHRAVQDRKSPRLNSSHVK